LISGQGRMWMAEKQRKSYRDCSWSVVKLKYGRHRHKEKIAQTGVGQWSSWNMDGRENEERVTETAVGQWSTWIINGTAHEEGVAQTGVGQWPGWNMDDNEDEEKVT